MNTVMSSLTLLGLSGCAGAVLMFAADLILCEKTPSTSLQHTQAAPRAAVS